MLFDRYRKTRRLDEPAATAAQRPQKSSNLAAAFFRALTRKPWYGNKQRQDSAVDLAPPRQSASLPNIARFNISTIEIPSPTIEPMLKPTVSTPPPRTPLLLLSDSNTRVAKRHSVEHRVSITMDDQPMKRVKRHSFTYGHALDDGMNRLSVTDVLPKRSVSQQLPPKLLPQRSDSATVKNRGRALSASGLSEMLSNEQTVMLIDVRNLFEYQRRRIVGSFNVNLPSLLIKRYQRGTVSNFNLENFITTTEGRASYTEKNKSMVQNWVVYDEDMLEPTSQAWTLLNVLERAMDTDSVYYLQGGFKAFQDEQYIIESDIDGGITGMDLERQVHLPRRSVSYTLGQSHEKTHLHRRTSLFSLDTQAARANNANALARRANKRAIAAHLDDQSASHRRHLQQQPQQQQQQQQQHLVAPSATNSTNSSLTRVVEDDEATVPITSPRTETDFEFVISEVIPGFLYVGPEIETTDQAAQLEMRHIRRVLNMAEECNDEVLTDSIVYRKISARDTVEMKNIDWVMMEAVCFIEDAKRHHEPIYVHCKAGKSRSITAILAYLVSSERWTLKQAYRHVIKARPNMSPNIGFIAELMKMEGRVHGRVSSFMETDWQSSSMPSPEFARELIELERAWQQTPRDTVPPVNLK
ncbi:hypothetical protein BX666DRAFT_2104040 [Dichotomocladium elegans]|nr:hypothetical protein BX666DRAFT_2104040 [Dichotomocladium elegans]